MEPNHPNSPSNSVPTPSEDPRPVINRGDRGDSDRVDARSHRDR